MNEPVVTLVGNLTADPELRFTPSGAAVANFTIAQTPRTKNTQTDQWEDGTPLFVRCSVWREYAENVAESLVKGQRVIASGRLTNREYTTNEGEKRTSLELQVDEIGPTLRFGSATFTRNGGGEQGGRQGGAQQQRRSSSGRQAPKSADPWAGSPWDNPPTGEPPF